LTRFAIAEDPVGLFGTRRAGFGVLAVGGVMIFAVAGFFPFPLVLSRPQNRVRYVDAAAAVAGGAR
jgi:hypothetical protein